MACLRLGGADSLPQPHGWRLAGGFDKLATGRGAGEDPSDAGRPAREAKDSNVSIASYSVVGRILAEVENVAPVAPLERLTSLSQVADVDQVFELRRTRHLHEPPFATSFHFWAHALHAFLARHARLDLFEALATHGLCERVDAASACSAVEALARRMSTRIDLSPESASRLGYRMIDQDVMASWVVESAGEQTAVFWARPSWMASAVPVGTDEAPGT
jgi:hypothetical protein